MAATPFADIVTDTATSHTRTTIMMQMVAFRVVDGRVEIVAARCELDAPYHSLPALKRPLTHKELTRNATEEHAEYVAEGGHS